MLRQGRYGATADDWRGFVSFFDSVIAAEENDGDVHSIGVEKKWVNSVDKGQTGSFYHIDKVGYFNEGNKYGHSTK